MADPVPFVLVLVTAIVSGGGGYLGNILRNRAAGRTAARLVHAELLQNAAGLIYYRDSGRLITHAPRRAAWDEHSQALARLRDATVFTHISDSYQALEAATYIAGAGEDEIPADLLPLLEDAIDRLTTGLRMSARLARLPEATILDEERLLGPRPVPPRGHAGTHLTIYAVSSIVQDTRRQVMAAASIVAATERPAAEPAWLQASSPRPLHGKLRRIILDARGKETIDGKIVRREGDPATGDAAVDEAYEGLGGVYEFFADVFGRDSYDGQAAELRAVVHYGEQFANVFWNGQVFVYGDGDGKIYHRFTRALDVTAAQFAHALISSELGLIYVNQPGALLNSLGDVLASLVKQHRKQQTVEQADWLIGDELAVRPGMRAMRSLQSPGTAYDDEILGKDPQPAKMSDFVKTIRDNGGVHINSGIPNRAFYLAATQLGGYAWERAGRIWYEAIFDSKVRPTSGFSAFASATIRAAGPDADTVKAAWRQVGVQLSRPKSNTPAGEE